MRKGADPRLQRSTHEKLKALDNELYLLRDHCERVRDSPSHIGALATVLRALVCESSRKLIGLLWRMVRELKINDTITVSMHIDPLREFPMLRKEVVFKISSICPGSDPRPGFSTTHCSLQDFITNQEAVTAMGKSLTFDALIKIIAQQIGTAHQAEKIDVEVRQIESIMINGQQSFVQPLVTIARLVLEVGERVLRTAESNKMLTRNRHKFGHGDFSFVMILRSQRDFSEPISIFRFRSLFFDISFEYSLNCSGMTIKILRDGLLYNEIHAPYIGDKYDGELVKHVLSYSSTKQRIRAMSWDAAADILFSDVTEKCEIGWLHGSDFEATVFDQTSKVLVFAISTKGITSLKQLKKLLDPVANGIVIDSEDAAVDDDTIFPH